MQACGIGGWHHLGDDATHTYIFKLQEEHGSYLMSMLQAIYVISKAPWTCVQMCWCHDWLQGNAHRVGWLAGVLSVMLRRPKKDWTCATGLARLLGPMAQVLQEDKARAVASGQTFERTVRLEAAVLGW